MPDFINIYGEILNEVPSNYEMGENSSKDLMFMKGFALEEGVNKNNALFEKTEIEKSYTSIVGKPLKIRFINNDPSGHGYNRITGEFDEIVKSIGYIYQAEGGYYNDSGELASECEAGKYKVLVHMVMWKRYYPEIASRLRELHNSNKLRFSIEADRDYELTEQGYRRCYNVVFNGLAVVKNPAWDNARSLLVAELLNDKGGKQMDFEKLYNEEKSKNEKLAGDLALAENENTDLKKQVGDLKVEVAEKEANIKDVSVERDNYKDKIETAEKEKLGGERFDKLSKYGEVVKTKDELAEMDTESFANLLIEKVENYKPSGQEQAEKDDIIGTHHETSKINRTNRKDQLLNMVEGLAKVQ